MVGDDRSVQGGLLHYVVRDLSATSQSKSKYYGFPLLFGMTGVLEEALSILLSGDLLS